ncbi:TLD domain-containing protein KIAA1609 [Pteropus alecto]|uniref:MTOR-associated protein MEAK7 n=1 Tax=Pteropus alecto TaxID=9402 RepID=L5JQS2_PTEAL|nr:TLD domain-containing protein KIAA1609 [Pteropus alecto]
MGNSKSRSRQNVCSQFLPAERAEMDRLFATLSSEKSSSNTSPRSFSLKALKARSHIGEALPPEMVTRLYNGMRNVDPAGKAKGPSESISQEQFTVSMSHLLKGNSEEKSLMILNMISVTEDGKKLLGPQLLDCDCDQAMIEDWVFRAHLVATFLSVVIHRGFLLRLSLNLTTLVPKCQVDQEQEFESVLDVLSVIFVNSHLPREQQHRWHLLFSTELHGHSFAQLCGRIPHRGPCVALLEDHDGYVFGGFASCSWEIKPQFQGDDKCFLFSISPNMAVHTCTGYNNHYMYLNHGQQTIPNGLADVGAGSDAQAEAMLMIFSSQGMGGQHNYFGLWIDVDFGKGHSKAKPTCTTYNSPQLSAKEDFQFEKMEANSGKSILDVDPEAQILLEVSGRGLHSQGLREPSDN